MKTLIFSDTHLDLPFEEKKYRFLESIIKPVDQVIINGDFWEGYGITFDQFIASPWRNLFPLLKSKNAIYLYGNHDQKRLADEDVTLFSTEQKYRHTVPVKDQMLILEHGNRLCKFFDEDPRQRYTLDGMMMSLVTDRIQRPATRILGPKIKRFGRKYNRRIKKKLRSELRANEIYVCGHTHSADFDLKNQFINSGFIKFGLAQYITVDEHGIQMQEEWYD